ncbi:MAG TPA: hypothetical protein VN326_03275 [Casimicrobiaceae bacterium]|nr:hypothetical protein [Casimicrobiaceae bacterium]
MCLSIAAAGGCTARLWPGGGVVRNSETQAPIADAGVTLVCMYYWNIHNSKVRKEVTVTTNWDGQYRFSFEDVSGCNWGQLRAQKNGYALTSGAYGIEVIDVLENSEIKQDILMTPLADANMRRLRIINSPSTFTSSKFEFMEIYNRFLRSKDIVQTQPERDYVAQSYCSRLEGLWAGLPAAERASVAAQYPPRGTTEYNIQREISGYCTRI